MDIDGILAKHGKLMSEVEQIAKEISESIEAIRDKSNFQYRTVEENYLRIRDISGLMEKIHGDSSRHRDNANEALGLAEINEQKINDTIRLITGMKEDSKKIEEISRTISEIADKTNLLSLNAAIESARAGEHGRGFAVVADEISKLATMSIDSSKEIAAIIRNTVGNIENASMTIENLAGYLSKIISFVKENSGFMETLNRNTEKELDESRVLYSSFVEVDRAAKDVIENADRQNQFIRQILEWFDNMRHLGREVSTSLKGLQQLSNRLDERSNEMKSVLERKQAAR
jgi:methyl-accepting chemotaxis protein